MNEITKKIEDVLKKEMKFNMTIIVNEEDAHLMTALSFEKTDLKMLFITTVDNDSIIVNFEKITSSKKSQSITKSEYPDFLKKISKVNNKLKHGKFLISLDKNDTYSLSYRSATFISEGYSKDDYKKLLMTAIKTVSTKTSEILG